MILRIEKRRATTPMLQFYPPQGNTDEIKYCHETIQALLDIIISYAATLLMDSGTLPV
jgi:hypothetical protein